LTGLIGAGVAVAGTSLLTGCAAAAMGQGTQPAQGSEWDMSWIGKLGRYKTAYDSPEVMSGAALGFAASAAQGYKQAMGVTDAFTPVLILRHSASVMALNDAMWERMGFGETNKLKDPTTGEANLKRNPFLTYAKGDKNSYTGAEAALNTLMAQGAIVLTCNRALTGIAYMLQKKEPATFATPAAALVEVRRNVIPGAYVMPNGIFAVSAAQDAGCNYMRVL
ncbi:MAG: hypothetical protein ABIY52_06870, partial [Gemmatimonadaceae bacterium]